LGLLNCRSSFPVAVSHERTGSLLRPEVRRVLPSGEKATTSMASGNLPGGVKAKVDLVTGNYLSYRADPATGSCDRDDLAFHHACHGHSPVLRSALPD